MTSSLPRLALLALCALCSPAHADNAAVQRCRQISDAAQRLVCYDAIALPPSPVAAAPAPAASPAASPARAVAPAPMAVAATTPAATPTPTATPAPSADRFGLPRSAGGSEPDAIESLLAKDIDGWGPNDVITLANGQKWQVSDDSNGVTRPGLRKVRVRRGAMGAFYMEFEGLNRSPRVRRIQ